MPNTSRPGHVLVAAFLVETIPAKQRGAVCWAGQRGSVQQALPSYRFLVYTTRGDPLEMCTVPVTHTASKFQLAGEVPRALLVKAVSVVAQSVKALLVVALLVIGPLVETIPAGPNVGFKLHHSSGTGS